jgi:PAS domain S-box-containing protein
MVSEKYLKEIFNSSLSPMMILLPDAPHFSIVDVNDAYLKLNEFTREESVGRGLFEVFYSDKYYEIPGWIESLDVVLAQKKPDKITLRKYEVPVAGTLDKKAKYWEIDNIPILNDDNEIAFIVRSITDHTHAIIARKNTEQALTESRNQLYSLVQTIEGIVWEADADTLRFTFVSDHVKQILGFSTKDWLGQPRFWENHIHPGDRDEVLNYYNLKSRPAKSYTFEYRMIKADGGTVWIKDIVSIVKEGGKPKWLRGLMLDITATRRLSNLENLEKNVLELNSKNHVTVQEILSYYLSGIEALFPKMLCSILQVKNNRLYNWASPSLPISYIQAIESLPIGEDSGSCGTAVYLKKKVIVSDIATDPRWADHKHKALKYELHACWSHPVVTSEGEVIATLGMYYKEPKKPNEEELKVIERVTAILKIILENRQKAEIIAETSVLMTQSQELAHFGNWHWDVQNNIVSWSNSLYAIYGLNKKTFKATFEGYQEMLHPDDRERVYNIISNVLKTKEDVEFEERIIRPNGEMRYLKSWGKLKCDTNGMPLEMIGACLDITESKKTQEELQSSESRLSTLADSQTNYVIRIGLDGKLTYFNKKYIEDFDWILKDKKITDIDSSLTVQPYHHQLVEETIDKCVKKPNKVFQVEIDKLDKAGGVKPTLWHFIGLTNSNGEAVEVQCIGLDVTDLKNAESAIKKQNKKLLEIAWMQSHVVRAPLTKIIGLVDLIKDFPNNDDEEKELLDHLLTCANELDNIIRSISAKTEQIDLKASVISKR